MAKRSESLGREARSERFPLDFLTYSILPEIEAEQGADAYYFPGRFVGHLHPATVYKWVVALLPEYSIHYLRHTAGSNGLQKTHDVRAVQELLGHESLETTMIYTFATDHSIRAVVEANSLARFFTAAPPTAQPVASSDTDRENIAAALVLLQQRISSQPSQNATAGDEH